MPTTPAWGHAPAVSAAPYPPVHTSPPTPLGPFNFTYAPSIGAEPVTLRGVITPLSAPLPAYLAQNSGDDALRTFIYADFIQRQAEPAPVCTCVYCPSAQGAVHSVPVFRVDDPQAPRAPQAPQAPPPVAVDVAVDLPSGVPVNGQAPPPSPPRSTPPTVTTGVQTDPVASPPQPKASVLQPPDRPPRRRVVSKTTPAGTADQSAPSRSEPAHESDQRQEGAGSTPGHTPKKRSSRRRREEDIPPVPPLPPLHSASLHRSPLDSSGSHDSLPPFGDTLTFSTKDKKKAKAESPPAFQILTWPRARLPPPRVPSVPFPLSLEAADESNTARPPPSQRLPLPDAWTNGGERPSVVPQVRDDTDWRLAMGSVKSLRKLAPRRKPTADVLNADFSASLALDDISVALSELARLLSLQEQSMEVTLGIGRNISNTLRDYIAPPSVGVV
ncbi:uncharacterized protein LOC62_05G007213 [Vanrija pseudolonga]|uniref:Uncharacterized protein n=1 Tax=Vanrija pseudolonga TaxID=143232 RepID=A0AAF0YF32_9TREE|nr:hypothetical protein LOC62_05G007213 [Vanrija pseudolonga]